MISDSGRREPTRDASHGTSRVGHTCAVCGEPITSDVWDMTVWASETTLAYITCIFAETV